MRRAHPGRVRSPVQNGSQPERILIMNEIGLGARSPSLHVGRNHDNRRLREMTDEADLGSLGKPDPLADCGEQDEAEETAGGVVVSGCPTSAVLQPVKEQLYAGTQNVQSTVDRMLHATALLGGISGVPPRARTSSRTGSLSYSPVGEQHLGVDVVLGHQVGISRAVVGLSGDQQNSERKTLNVGAQVDFGRETAARTAKSLILIPPLAPAAQWCARTMVLPIIWSASSPPPSVVP